LKSALVGGIGAAVVIWVSAALAGSGVGGIFNLGKVNSVNGTSSLTGTTVGPQLLVSNGNSSSQAITAQAGSGTGVALYGLHSGATGAGAAVRGQTASAAGPGVLGVNIAGGPGLSSVVKAGKPPLQVNSATVVPSLNADMLDGLHANGLALAARISITTPHALDSGNQLYGSPLTITAPKAGFVVVNATVTIRNDGSCTSVCLAGGHVTNIESSTDSTGSLVSVPKGPFVSTYGTLSSNYVFPVSAGVNDFDLVVFGSDTLDAYSGEMNALYVPFGSTGGATLKPPPR